MKSWKLCLRSFLGILAPIRGGIALSVGIGVVRIAVSLGFVWICKHVVDIATGVSSSSLTAGIIILLSLIVVRIISMVAASVWENILTIRTQNKMRFRLFSDVMRSQWSGRDDFHSGDIVNRLEEDIRVTTDCACFNTPAVIITILQLIAASAFLFTMQPFLAVALIVIMPLAILCSKFYFRKIRTLTSQIRTTDSHVQQHMQENIQHRLLIRSFEATGSVLDKMGFLQNRKYSLVQSRLYYSSAGRTFMAAGFLFGYVAAFLWGVYGLRDHTVTYGMMTAFLQLVSQIQRPIADISQHIPAFIHTFSSVERLMELSELPREEMVEARPLQGAVGVRVEHLTFGYPGVGKSVLNDFSYDFKPGTSTVIMGETGAGKSTLIRLILSLLTPSGGSITLYNGQEQYIADVSTRCNFMYVPQASSLMSGTIRQNLLLAKADASDQEMFQALHVSAADFVSQLPQGLDTPCSEQGNGLSQGQAQRIAIARALLRPGNILILDESTSALDAETESLLLQRLDEHLKGRKTLIWISHRTAMEATCQVLRI